MRTNIGQALRDDIANRIVNAVHALSDSAMAEINSAAPDRDYITRLIADVAALEKALAAFHKNS